MVIDGNYWNGWSIGVLEYCDAFSWRGFLIRACSVLVQESDPFTCSGRLIKAISLCE